MEEYYLTGCEKEVLELHSEEIAGYFKGHGDGFDLIELGAGDGRKTRILLSLLNAVDYDFIYKPVDISQNALDQLKKDLNHELPAVQVIPERGEYFEVLDNLKKYDRRKKVIMMLGSNIGNLLHERAIKFLSRMQSSMHSQDILFMGFDQKKDPAIIHRAYSDPHGITERFNKNLLLRINRELGGDFEPSRFKHWETYNPETGTARSYLVALEPMEVRIPEIGLIARFEKWETIHTEISQKYDDKVVEWLAAESGLKIMQTFSDTKNYYSNYVFGKAN